MLSILKNTRRIVQKATGLQTSGLIQVIGKTLETSECRDRPLQKGFSRAVLDVGFPGLFHKFGDISRHGNVI